MSDDPIKDVLRMMPYGFYSLTSRNGDEVNAMVANWISQVSFTPRLLSVGLAKNSYSYGLVTQGKVFGLNLFHKDNEDAIIPYSKSRAKKPEKMQDAKYTEAPETGVPILEGAAAYIEFRVKQVIDIGGDHELVIGEPVGAGVMQEGEPGDMLSLVTLGWSYAG